MTGSIALAGTSRAEISIPSITLEHKIRLKTVSAAMTGVVVVSEITPGAGFALSSTSPNDVGMLVYFDVYSVPPNFL